MFANGSEKCYCDEFSNRQGRYSFFPSQTTASPLFHEIDLPLETATEKRIAEIKIHRRLRACCVIIVNSTIEHLASVFLTPVGGEIYTSETNNMSTNSNATLHHNKDQIACEKQDS